jgi:hypothetical protein
MRAIRQKYSEEENSNEIDWYCDLVNQPIGTVGEDDWMAEMMLSTGPKTLVFQVVLFFDFVVSVYDFCWRR